MIPVLIDGPNMEPVSLEDMQTFLRVDQTEENVLIQALITSARLIIEAQVRRIFIGQTWRFVRNQWPPDDHVPLPLGPVLNLIQVKVYNRNGIGSLVDASLYGLDKTLQPPCVVLNQNIPIPGRPVQGIEIDVRLGYGETVADVPQPLRQAIKMLVARWFENRGDITDYAPPVLPGDVLALIAPYRQIRL